jgi:hypothetical protein
MTFRQVGKKILSRLWFVALVVLISSMFSLILLDARSYQASVTFGVVPVNEKVRYETIEKKENDPEQIRYAAFMNVVTESLVKRFATQDIQARIAQDIGLPTQNIDVKKPFYEINYIDLGYVNLVFRNNDRARTEQFLKSTTATFSIIVESWNTDYQLFRLKYATQPFPAQIVELTTPMQLKIFPVLVLSLLSLGLMAVMPKYKYF